MTVRMAELVAAGRFRQDLTRLSEETLITSNERFYIRSRCPDLIDFSKPWEIARRPGSPPRGQQLFRRRLPSCGRARAREWRR